MLGTTGYSSFSLCTSLSSISVSLQLSLDNFELQPPVTFRLTAGSGPVHLAGWHRTGEDSCEERLWGSEG